MKDFYIGQIVSHESPIWKPQGKLKITKIHTGNRSGIKIITATDESGKEFTAAYGVFHAT